MPTSARPDGISDSCSAFRSVDDERFSAVGCSFAPVPAPSPQPQSESDSDLCEVSPSVEERRGVHHGGPAGDGDVQGYHDNGRFPVRVGSNDVRQSGEWLLGSRNGPDSHKCFGALGSVSSAETLPAISPRPSCSGENRQLHCGSLCQPSGRHSLTTVTQVGSGDDTVEQHQAPLTQGDTCAGSSEQRGGLDVSWESSVRGMVSAPAGCGPDLEEIRPSRRRSLRLAGKRPLSAVFLPVGHHCTSRCGCSGSPVAKRAALRIPSPQSDFPHPGQGEGAESVSHTGGAKMAVQTLGGGNSSDVGGRPLASAHTQRPPVPGTRGDLPPPPRPRGALGLARERFNLDAAGLPPQVIDTIQSARASSTRALYGCKWRVFEEWCESRLTVPFQCSVVDLLCFLQELVDKGRAFSTVKVYLAAISACHVGFGDKPVGQHPLVCRFMKGARRKLPVSRHLVPLWDLLVVLDALSQHPFEPLEAVGMKFVSLKTVLLLALSTAKRVSDLQALSIRPSCLQFGPGLSKVCLRPNPAFVPKVVESAYRCPTVELLAFHPPPFSSTEEQRLNTLCPVRALQSYVSRTADFRRTDQLFVSWSTTHKGKPLSRQRLSHWIVEAISVAYSCKGLLPPQGLRAHSTRSIAASWALFRGVSVQDICAAASWATPHTFVKFYRLDVSGPSLAQVVLGAGAPGLE
uniref:uncharacterized protein LOC122773567 n=1 Tax=Solea senegalensis TaxID=28829 RepID=UPI001CD8DDD2|nr:uncharacterized protein LOC122773567 [Solea senegalensis]